MARLLHTVVERPRPCSYLPERLASLEHRILVDTTPDELQHLLVRGWRRFGPDTFRPACGACTACIPVRVVVAGFRPSKSERRALRACAGFRTVLGPPRVDAERLVLHRTWHAFREKARGWQPTLMGFEDYALSFAFPHTSGRELAVYDDAAGGRLAAIGICDETAGAWSAVYFFYHPDYAALSLGVANVLWQIELARARSIPHVYLGFLVEGCASMAYKARYRPSERLVGWPADDEEPVWAPFGVPDGVGEPPLAHPRKT